MPESFAGATEAILARREWVSGEGFTGSQIQIWMVFGRVPVRLAATLGFWREGLLTRLVWTLGIPVCYLFTIHTAPNRVR